MFFKYPRIVIQFCTKCKWTLRASWYQQELFQTFGESIGEIALQPAESGTFQILLVVDDNNTTVIWDRKLDGGFPDSKVVKQRVRNVLFPEKDLGHVDRSSKAAMAKEGVTKEGVTKEGVTKEGVTKEGVLAGESSRTHQTVKAAVCLNDNGECVECNQD
ncbi:hypothetical protein BABINDRAFT_163958 [Babjeviella inositovora NRRL Y-12698]|uniref:Selenoprotein W-like protein n=1 Tax=Babjeviella inositovora NRRL Y-12698 TaxID=984486 RepID=A0A1E3QJ00_9ASCO|nr:uncharacterized protein BABINDRAFT_163958 [Babjeviella inositovora NRRL Y-12698]ODQ76957.1 hypothetical protein BABINDRAFT_163958 [Babjeviella inositovora NRRL Y-12698]